ncbi:hypothetical protein A4A49_02377 [Nicotiana attenuata]|uniref:Carboxypeptidase A inhibitor-like domain-containing protein n=1 Tax=Nicotiana attenuata TaxID=49451 RepID=A0A1J6I4Y6_NICAT|nr:hypothetical protein A4A49_02377 [Nicotiana attenuata]
MQLVHILRRGGGGGRAINYDHWKAKRCSNKNFSKVWSIIFIMASLKLCFILSILLMVITVNVPWISITQVIATSLDVDHDLSIIEKRLLPQLNWCFSPCTSDSDCSNCWICCTCSYNSVDNQSSCRI